MRKNRICTTGGKKGGCGVQDANYKIECECGSEYNGKTSRSSYVRGNEHFRDLQQQAEVSDLWNHCRDEHDGINMEYKMTVTETFKNDALLKQVSEAVKIKNVPMNKRLNTKYENNIQINI